MGWSFPGSGGGGGGLGCIKTVGTGGTYADIRASIAGGARAVLIISSLTESAGTINNASSLTILFLDSAVVWSMGSALFIGSGAITVLGPGATPTGAAGSGNITFTSTNKPFSNTGQFFMKGIAFAYPAAIASAEPYAQSASRATFENCVFDLTGASTTSKALSGPGANLTLRDCRFVLDGQVGAYSLNSATARIYRLEVTGTYGASSTSALGPLILDGYEDTAIKGASHSLLMG